MARSKSKRELRFKPKFKEYAPAGERSGSIVLLHEEIEAIYLMDYSGMYQEQAAASMGISRTTLSRIIKSARTKVSTALINGKTLLIDDEKEEFTIAYITQSSEGYGALGVREEYLVFVEIAHEEIMSQEILLNPLYGTEEKPTHILPDILYSRGVNYFIAGNAGIGLSSALMTKGIFTIVRDTIVSDSDLLSIIRE
jgi:predicted DNA-binding protein (UPF0251 family)